MRSPLALFERPKIAGPALRGYRRERITEVTFPIATALMEGGFVGVIADKVYHVHPIVLAVISAAPMFGNVSSLLWARLAVGRRKVPFVVALQVLLVALVALVAWAPAGRSGAWILVTIMVAVRLVLAGIITVRSMVWSLNYPRDLRGRLTGRLAILTSLTITLTSFVASRVLDADPESFRAMYGVGALLAVIGIVMFSRVPLVGEETQLSLERGEHDEEDVRAPGARPASGGLWSVLREDPLYARYLTWQFIAGVANMMIEAPLIYLVSRQLGASWIESIAITMVIPFFLSTVTIPLWAVYLDRVHIAHFRAWQSTLWFLSQLATWLGALQGSLPLIALGRVVLGLARGGGALAWQLGHNDFSSQRMLAVYMGVHVTLTGVRGAFAPFMGMLLYVGWSAFSLPRGWEIPAFGGIGASVFLLSCSLTAIAGLGFLLLHRRIRGMESA